MGPPRMGFAARFCADPCPPPGIAIWSGTGCGMVMIDWPGIPLVLLLLLLLLLVLLARGLIGS